MANITKINADNLKIIIDLHSKSFNPTAISKMLRNEYGISLAKDTVKKALIENGIVPHHRKNSLKKNMIDQMIEEVKSKNGVNWSRIVKKYEISFEKAKKVLLENNVKIRDRKEGASMKTLSKEEVMSRIGDPDVEFIGFNDGKYHFRHKDGRIFSKKSGKLYQGNPLDKSGKPITTAQYIERISKFGYELVSDFNGTKKSSTVKCDNGHIVQCVKASYATKYRCPICYQFSTSAAEKDLLEEIRKHYPSADKLIMPKERKRNGRGKEIDIYIPELKLGIEYNGMVWHKELNAVDHNDRESVENTKHYKKMLIANSFGIRVINIWDLEFKKRKSQIMGYLKSAMKVNSVKLNARDCTVQIIDKSISSVFLEENHIQGDDKLSKFSFGLFYKDNLVGVMTMGAHPQGTKNEKECYLTRLCFKIDTSVRGGSSKLLKAFKVEAIKLGYTKIVSWSDNRWSDGGVYRALGFYLDVPKRSNGKTMGLSDGSIWPDRIFLYKTHPISRYKRNALIKSGTDESEFDVVYDCGKKRWSLDL